jgi:hypothetical protein
MRNTIFILCIYILSIANCIGQSTTQVSFDSNGKLVYKSDAKGNTVPDFSGVGYKNSEENIPENIKIVKTVSAVAGDNLLNIQNAINEVSAMNLDSDGFRGAILFKKGEYQISNSISVNTSGIVLLGEGPDSKGTRFVATKTDQFDLIKIAGKAGVTANESTATKITDSYVSYGSKIVTVQTGHSFQVGDWVYLRRAPKQAWIDLLNTAQYGWTTSGYKVNYERKITKIEGNVLYLDAPVMDCIEPLYADGYIVKIASSRIQNCGIENIRLVSTYTAPDDEKHGWNAVFFDKIINGWARNLEVYYFGYSAVNLGEQARWVTVDHCRMFDPMSETTGGRKYSFNVDGQRNLVKNCATRGGRHDYVNGSCTAGPNVFLNSSSIQEFADIGPHHRWSTGILFDNIVSDGSINVQNRQASGTGHGWAGSQTMFWNCDVPHMIVQSPPADHTNWAVGCVANITNIGDWTTEKLGVVESKGTHVTPSSLFEAQLSDRLPPSLPAAPRFLEANAISPTQINLSWVDESYNEQRFRIERSADKGVSWSALATTNPNTKYYANTGIPDTISYYYRLKAENAMGNSAFSNIAKASTRLEAIPAPWISADIGNPTALGTAGYYGGKFLVNGSGTDIYGNADQFQYVYQPLKGNGEIVAQVLAISNSNEWAKAGVMIRESTNSNAANAFVLVSPTSGIGFQQRQNTGSSSSMIKGTGASPFWVKLVRNNNTFSGFRSSDGIIWDKVGEVNIAMAVDVLVGMAVSSHVAGLLCSVQFDNVAVVKNIAVGLDNHADQSITRLVVSPNPIHGSAALYYTVSKKSLVRLSILDLRGTELKSLVNSVQTPGNYSFSFEVDGIPNGTFFVRMLAGNKTESFKIIVMK